MSAVKKTNAMRELDVANIPYQVLTYPVDENNLSAEYVAEKIGYDIKNVFKTLALLNENKELLIACIPGDRELDLKKLARVAQCKRVEMLELKLLLGHTGYVRGGCSPIGIKKRHRAFLHNSALEYENIVLSAGQRGIQVKLAPQDLVNHLKMSVADIVF